MNKEKIIIDTDPGIDDAVAIAVALFADELDVQMITTVAGNVDLEKTTNNALRLVDFLNKKIPVAKGAAEPLVSDLVSCADIHGDSGMDGFEFNKSTLKPMNEHAVLEMRNALLKSDEKITLVPIGPLTNIALLLKMFPEVKSKIKRIVLMGGSIGVGNCTQAAEFNIYVDPEAAKIVFDSGLNIVMCGLDVTNFAILLAEQINEIRHYNKTGEMLFLLFQHYRGGSMKTGLKMHDACAVMYLLKPEIFTADEYFVDIETSGEYSRGKTIVDIKGKLNRKPNATVCTEINVDKFCEELIYRLKNIKIEE
jgi:non-specific riboncleoside hydrolase